MALERRFSLAVVLALLAIIAATTVAILLLCHGKLIYTLDDPYISLALSDQIAHGHYGINATEPASPSSSILYPFLLALFAWAPWQDWAPLIITRSRRAPPERSWPARSAASTSSPDANNFRGGSTDRRLMSGDQRRRSGVRGP